MKFKIILVLAMLCSLGATAQTIINRTYPVKAGQKLALKFMFPVVKLSTWDKNEVGITARVSINDGEHDNAYVLNDHSAADLLRISDLIKDKEKLPRRYTIRHAEQKITFKSKAEMDAYRKNAGSIQSYSEGIDIDIQLEVRVPAGMHTEVESMYGIVELKGFNAPLTVDAIYGGIDASLTKAKTGELTATTNYGNIYSNLDLELTDKKYGNFLNSITARPGRGPAYHFKSAFGKIYLRKE